MTTSNNLVFIDIETINLDLDGDSVWEVAIIDGDVEQVWHMSNVPLHKADVQALNINGFLSRYGNPHWLPKGGVVGFNSNISRLGFASQFMQLTWGKTLVGANPCFDASRLQLLLESHGCKAGWNHRLIDVQALAMGYLNGAIPLMNNAEMNEQGWSDVDAVKAPLSLSATAELMNITYDMTLKHTALGDARVAKAIYERIVGK